MLTLHELSAIRVYLQSYVKRLEHDGDLCALAGLVKTQISAINRTMKEIRENE